MGSSLDRGPCSAQALGSLGPWGSRKPWGQPGPGEPEVQEPVSPRPGAAGGPAMSTGARAAVGCGLRGVMGGSQQRGPRLRGPRELEAGSSLRGHL